MTFFVLIVKSAVPQPAAHAAHVGGRGHRHRRLPVPAHLHRRLVRRRRRRGHRSRWSCATRSRSSSRCRSPTSTRCSNVAGRERRLPARTGSAASIQGRAQLLRQVRRRRPTSSRCTPRSMIKPEQLQGLSARIAQGAIVGDAPGREVRLEGGRPDPPAAATSIPATGTSTCAASTSRTRAPSTSQTMFFHWKYLNEKQIEARKDQVGLIVVQVNDAVAVDRRSAQRDRRDCSPTRWPRRAPRARRRSSSSFISMASALIERDSRHLDRGARHPHADPGQHAGDGDARAHHRVRGHARHRLSAVAHRRHWCSAKAS